MEEKEVRRLWALRSYIEQAWEQNLPSSRRQIPLNPTVRKAVRHLAEELKPFQETLQKTPPLFNPKLSKDAFRQFLLKEPALSKVLLQSSSLLKFKKSKKKAKRWKRWVGAPLSLAAHLCHGASYHYPIPPVEGILSTLASSFLFLKQKADHQACLSDPRLKEPPPLKAVSTYAGIAGGVALLGLSLGSVLNAPLAAVGGPILMALGTVGLSFSSLKESVEASRSLLQTSVQKEPVETYSLRVLEKTFKAVKQWAHSVFYLGMSLLSVAAVGAVLANPISLSVLHGSMAAFSLITAGVMAGSSLLSKAAKAHVEKKEQKAVVEAEPMKPSSSLVKKSNDLLEKMQASYRTTETPPKPLVFLSEARVHPPEIKEKASKQIQAVPEVEEVDVPKKPHR